MFDPIPVITQLKANTQTFEGLLAPARSLEYQFKPAPEKWCLQEIVGHLLDEERLDFRARIQHIFTNNHEPMPSINPPAWVEEHGYMDQIYENQLALFIDERLKSIEWLHTHVHADWGLFYLHPKLGTMSAGMLLHNWLAHDYLHIRQILGVKHAWLQQFSGENLDYAGNW